MIACVDCGKKVGWPLHRCYECTIDHDERTVGAQRESVDAASVDWQSRAMAAEALLDDSRRALFSVADSTSEHAYQELASALEAPPRVTESTDDSSLLLERNAQLHNVVMEQQREIDRIQPLVDLALKIGEASREFDAAVNAPPGPGWLAAANGRQKDLALLLDQAAALAGKESTPSERRWIVELEPGVWWSDGPGDPPRTTVEANAMRFSAHGYAQIALGCARKYRQFIDAQIVEVES